jgi:hypothetical protein
MGLAFYDLNSSERRLCSAFKGAAIAAVLQLRRLFKEDLFRVDNATLGFN